MSKLVSVFELVIVLRMDEGTEKIENAIDVGSETLSDPMMVWSSASPGSKLVHELRTGKSRAFWG